ncbi:MAG: histidine kinase [Candidatus Thiodiazotropha endolucinida]|nr:histidine kinase [Candidatus Thiodiazotropha taylori]MCW4313799.1 histidine kinase [Candidatus Thiodiazotropha taylori]
MPRDTQQENKKSVPPEKSKVLFLPNFCAIRVVFAVVVICELLAIILSLAAVERLEDFMMPLSRISLMVQWIGLSSAGLICLFRKQLNRFGNWGAGMASFLILMGMTLLVYQLIVWLNLGIDSAQPATEEAYSELLPRALAISAIVGILVLHYLYLQHLWRCQEEAENSARLQALHSRIRPHFLFNSMNTIASLTRSDPKLAEEVVEDLADLFRVSLGDAARPSTLGKELELARQYLGIEHYRLGERLEVVWSLDEALPDQAVMPPMILQPLLENAVYHGIEPAPDGGRITLSGHYRRKRINLSIRNTLPASHQTSQRQGNQLAMENIRARLAGVYDLEASLTEAIVDGEYQVRLVIPHPWWG